VNSDAINTGRPPAKGKMQTVNRQRIRVSVRVNA